MQFFSASLGAAPDPDTGGLGRKYVAFQIILYRDKRSTNSTFSPQMPRRLQELCTFARVIVTSLQQQRELIQLAVQSQSFAFGKRWWHHGLMSGNETLSRGKFSFVSANKLKCIQELNVSWALWPIGTNFPLPCS